MDSTFIKHSPCPKCGSRDNLAVYSDGHEWCFGCGYYKHPTRTISNSRPKEEESIRDCYDTSYLFGAGSTSVIPEKPLTWLKKYGITDEEINTHKIRWVPDQSSLLLGNQMRYFGTNPDHPKAISIAKGRIVIGDSDYGIFVEDFLSAIKVGRSFTGIPLFGSHINDEALLWAAKTFCRVGVWLDPDMTKKASKFVLRGMVLCGKAKFFRVSSDLDPKYYNSLEIQDLVKSSM